MSFSSLGTQASESILGTNWPATLSQQEGPSEASILQPKVAVDIRQKYTKHNINMDRIKISMPNDLLIEGSKAWDNTLVGYFIGKGLPFWDKAGLLDMYAMDSGYFFFKFNSKEERMLCWKEILGILLDNLSF